MRRAHRVAWLQLRFWCNADHNWSHTIALRCDQLWRRFGLTAAIGESERTELLVAVATLHWHACAAVPRPIAAEARPTY